jgi:hypothetical protein
MLLKLNSGLGISMLCLCALGLLAGVPIIHIVQLHISGTSTIIPEGQWIYSLFFIFGYLDHIMVAIWLFLNVPHFKEDTLTWVLCGLAFGIFAVPLFVSVIIFQRNYGVKFRTSISSLMLALLPYYAAKYFADYFFNHYGLGTLPAEWRIDETASGIMHFYFGGVMFIMNVVLAAFILRVLNGKNRSWIWALSTLVMGAAPVIIKLSLLVYFRKGTLVREMSTL